VPTRGSSITNAPVTTRSFSPFFLLRKLSQITTTSCSPCPPEATHASQFSPTRPSIHPYVTQRPLRSITHPPIHSSVTQPPIYPPATRPSIHISVTGLSMHPSGTRQFIRSFVPLAHQIHLPSTHTIHPSVTCPSIYPSVNHTFIHPPTYPLWAHDYRRLAGSNPKCDFLCEANYLPPAPGARRPLGWTLWRSALKRYVCGSVAWLCVHLHALSGYAIPAIKPTHLLSASVCFNWLHLSVSVLHPCRVSLVDPATRLPPLPAQLGPPHS